MRYVPVAAALALAGWLLPMSVSAQWQLDSELNDVAAQVEVLDVQSDGRTQVAQGALAVMVSNQDERPIQCKLLPGEREADTGLQPSLMRLIEPGQRAVLEMGGEHGDASLTARLICHPRDGSRGSFD